MSTSPEISVRVTHGFTASPERVFDAWLRPEMIGRWMFGPQLRDEEVLHLEADPRVGGAFSFLVRRQGQEIDHVGEYLEIDRPRRLVFTWAIRENLPETSRVEIDIAPRAGGCELTLVHRMDPQWAEYADRTRDSWAFMLEAMDRALRELDGGSGRTPDPGHP